MMAPRGARGPIRSGMKMRLWRASGMLALALLAGFAPTAQASPLVATVAAPALAQDAPLDAPRAQSGAATAEDVSLFQAFFVQRRSGGRIEWLGTGLIWLLLALSAGSIGLLAALARDNRRAALYPEDVRRDARRLASKGSVHALRDRLAPDRSFFAQVLAEGVAEAEHGRGAMLEALARAAEERTAARQRLVETLAIVGHVAPMIGLFGTVYGMILAFGEIVASGGAPDPVGLAAGIGTALTTTFWGLVVAIPAMAGAALLRTAVEGRTSEAILAAERVINRLADRTDADMQAQGSNDSAIGTAAAPASAAAE